MLSRCFNGEPEQVHLLVNFPSAVAISRLVSTLKGVWWVSLTRRLAADP